MLRRLRDSNYKNTTIIRYSIDIPNQINLVEIAQQSEKNNILISWCQPIWMLKYYLNLMKCNDAEIGREICFFFTMIFLVYFS